MGNLQPVAAPFNVIDRKEDCQLSAADFARLSAGMAEMPKPKSPPKRRRADAAAEYEPSQQKLCIPDFFPAPLFPLHVYARRHRRVRISFVQKYRSSRLDGQSPNGLFLAGPKSGLKVSITLSIF
jgi:hypothetical protein